MGKLALNLCVAESLDSDATKDRRKGRQFDAEELVRPGSQDHLYLDPDSALAMLPKSVTCLTIYANIPALCARVTDTPAA